MECCGNIVQRPIKCVAGTGGEGKIVEVSQDGVILEKVRKSEKEEVNCVKEDIAPIR